MNSKYKNWIENIDKLYLTDDQKSNTFQVTANIGIYLEFSLKE